MMLFVSFILQLFSFIYRNSHEKYIHWNSFSYFWNLLNVLPLFMSSNVHFIFEIQFYLYCLLATDVIYLGFNYSFVNIKIFSYSFSNYSFAAVLSTLAFSFYFALFCSFDCLFNLSTIKQPKEKQFLVANILLILPFSYSFGHLNVWL